jgi:glycosyltransferase involved in cell wall biosynthesis
LHFLGRLNDDVSLKLAYSAAHVFVLTSRQDNLPNTALEAQACGTPVAAFDVGGLRDAISHLKTGYLAEPFNIEDLAEGVGFLVDKGRHSKVSKASRVRATKIFCPEIVHSKYLDLYREIVGSKD